MINVVAKVEGQKFHGHACKPMTERKKRLRQIIPEKSLMVHIYLKSNWLINPISNISTY